MPVQFICPHGFSFSLPGVETEYVEPVWPTAWHPAAPFLTAACPRRCSGCHIFIWQRYHYHPIFQTICQQWPMPRCRSHFSFFYYNSLFDPYLCVKRIESIMIADFFHTLDKSLMRTSASWRSLIPHHFIKMHRMFCVLKDIFIVKKDIIYEKNITILIFGFQGTDWLKPISLPKHIHS